MHKETTMKHGSHRLHDGMLTLWRHIDEHLHSRHFWAGVAIAILIVGIVTMLFILARNAPIMYPTAPYSPYGY
jgi:hypothetical protein